MIATQYCLDPSGFPEGPKGLHLAGLLLAHWRNPLAFWLHLSEEYGDIVHFSLAKKHVFFVRHPAAIKTILVTEQANFVKGVSYNFADRFWGNGLLSSEGDLHHNRRRLIHPAFHRSQLAHYGEVMTTATERMTNRWQPGAVVDVEAEMRRLTCEIICQTLFSMTPEDAESIYQCIPPIVTFLEFAHLSALPFGSLIPYLRYRSALRFRKALNRLNRTVFELIELRRNTDADHRDLLSMLLEAGIDAIGIRDEVVTLAAAGHESSARTLAWLWHSLSEHRDVSERLHDEVSTVVGNKLPELEDLSRLTYTGSVVDETLRLYPPAFGIGRRVLKDYDMNGLHMPPGSSVIICPYVTHRDPRFFRDPWRFVPERWRSQESTERPELAYFPFGAGLRRCIGEHFARTEMILVTATIAREWTLHTLPGQKVEPIGCMLLRPRSPIKMRLERRPTGGAIPTMIAANSGVG